MTKRPTPKKPISKKANAETAHDEVSNQADDAPGIEYESAVAEAKTIVQQESMSQLLLGRLADTVQPKYGEQTLKQFAADIGVALCTLERHRSVFRAWEKIIPEISAPGPISITTSYSACCASCRITPVARSSGEPSQR